MKIKLKEILIKILRRIKKRLPPRLMARLMGTAMKYWANFCAMLSVGLLATAFFKETDQQPAINIAIYIALTGAVFCWVSILFEVGDEK